MDSIQFHLTTSPFEDEETIQLAVETAINGQQVVKWDDLPIDILELLSSADKSGHYCIWTCVCGIPECGGVDAVGIKVTHTDKFVEWTNLGYPLEDVKQLRFDKIAYMKAIKQFWYRYRSVYLQLKHEEKEFQLCPDLKKDKIVALIYDKKS